MYRILITILFCFSLQAVHAQRAKDTFQLYFDLNIPTLNKATQKKIDVLIFNDRIISGSVITIVGYADYLGSVEHNKDLSMKRAENVKDYLVKYGVNASDIKVCVGRGEVERAGLTDKGGFPSDRRVDIVVNNRTIKKVPPGNGKLVSKPRRDTSKVVGSIDAIKHLKPGATILLKNVYFPADRHVIKPESAETLEKLYAALRDNPNIKISIEGHVCCIKDAPDALDIDTYEPTLSVNRAKAIYKYLIDRGIDASRLKYEGFGRRRPVVDPEYTEEDADKNRRVEVRITENK